ncbi:MAG: hypothetical protein NC399_08380 [Muribaculum sp.]|nr:hypothetical protein [Muribaculum sp.]
MENIRVYESIVDETIKNEIKEANWCMNLIQYATYKCGIDGLIASAYLFCPKIIQIKGYFFIEQFWNCSIEESADRVSRLEEQYAKDKKMIEMSVNTWSIGDLFIGDSRSLMDNERVIQQFGNAIAYFWKCRVKELFPEKEIIVELGNDLMGEFGLCITMYEAKE